MPSFKLPENALYDQREGQSTVKAVKKEAFDKFNPVVLGLGDVNTRSVAKGAIAALFDLQEFTVFCKQIDPHLSVPAYMHGFLDWIFNQIREETVNDQFDEGVTLWHDLPFFTKFMGDGLLVLWASSSMDFEAQHNLIVSCSNIIFEYENTFLKQIRRKVADAPPRLRCGIAKGTVFSIGNGEDYVGSCINVAARLQKLAPIKIAFTRRGFDPETGWRADYLKEWTLKLVSIRGISKNELVYLRREDFQGLSEADAKLFRDP
jgi:class 3 adenylate cyclase